MRVKQLLASDEKAKVQDCKSFQTDKAEQDDTED